MTSTLDYDTGRVNARLLYLEVFWMGPALVLEWYFLNVFAIRLGATAAHIGTLTSMRALMLLVGAGLCAPWQIRHKSAVDALKLPIIIYRFLLYPAIALVPFLPNAQVDVMVFLAVLAAIPQGLASGIFLGMLRGAIRDQELPAVMARRALIMNVAVLAWVIILGQLLEHTPFPTNYQIVFILAFALSCISWWVMGRVKLAAPGAPATPGPAKKVSVKAWQHPPFMRFMLIVVALFISVCMAAPAGSLQLVRTLRASDTWISVFSAVELSAGALIVLYIQRLQARFSTSRLILLGIVAVIAQPLILALTTTLPPYLIAEVGFGAGWFALGLLLYIRLTEIAPQEGFATYAAIFQMVISASLFVAPLFGTFLIENVMSIPAALLVSGGLRLATVGVAWLLNPRAKTALPVRAVEMDTVSTAQ